MRITALALSALLTLIGPAAAQQRVQEPARGFAAVGLDYPAAAVPMNPLEGSLASALAAILERIGGENSATLGHLAGVSGGSVLGVKVNGRGDLLVNLDPRLAPRFWGTAIEDFTTRIGRELRRIAGVRLARVGSITFVFGGKDPAAYDSTFVAPPRAARAGKGQGSVMIAAAHGVYYNHGSRKWVPQRDRINGIREDYITPLYAKTLAELVRERSGAKVVFARSRSERLHKPSGKPWKHMAARYYVKRLLPDRKDIWHSCLSAGANICGRDDLIEYDEDIRTRPFFANYSGVDYLVNIHTNAASPEASGSQIIYYDGGDALLADNIACAMQEVIRSRKRYKDFRIYTPSIEDKGEVRLAAMPAVIVEVAFHTNPDDAKALKDFRFRRLSMTGVEKGIRLTRLGRICRPLRIVSVTDAEIEQGSSGRIAVKFEGFPRFPLTLTARVRSCPSGWTCVGTKKEIKRSATSVVGWRFACPPAGGDTETVAVETKLVDADGVSTEPVASSVHCVPAAAATARASAIRTGEGR